MAADTFDAGTVSLLLHKFLHNHNTKIYYIYLTLRDYYIYLKLRDCISITINFTEN